MTFAAELTGEVDPLLRMHPQAHKWSLKVLPLREDDVDVVEAALIKMMEPNLNTQQPYIPD